MISAMDNPDPLASIRENDSTDSGDEDEEEWNLHSNGVSRSEVFGALEEADGILRDFSDYVLTNTFVLSFRTVERYQRYDIYALN